MGNQSSFSFRRQFRAVTVGQTALRLLLIPLSLLIARLISQVVVKATDGQTGEVLRLSLWTAAVLLLDFLLQTGGGIVLKRMTAKGISRCRAGFVFGMLCCPLPRLFSAGNGELLENMNDDLEAVADRYTVYYPSLAADSLTAAAYVFFLAIQSPLAAASLVGLALLQLIPPMIVKKYMQVNYDQCREIEAQITDHVTDGVNAFSTIKLYGLKKWWLDRLAGLHQTYLRIGNKASVMIRTEESLFALLDNLLKFGAYGLMGVYMMRGLCSMETAVQAIYLSGELYAAAKGLFAAIPKLAVSQKAGERLSQWQAPPRTDLPPEALSGENVLRAENLGYRFGEKPVFRGLNLSLDPQKIYLLEGPNGAGKSTLLNLLTGLLSPEQGRAILGGADVGDLPPAAYPRTLLYIPQQAPPFGFSPRTLFGFFPESEELERLSAAFGLPPETLERPCQELSGGQRKKVLLALGFGLKPQWLLLDEPTNDLDRQGKDTLLELLSQRSGVLMVSHDLALENARACRLRLEGGCLYE